MKKDLFNSEIFTRAVEDIITRDELKKLFEEKRRLRIKHGIDATSPDLHLGHAASLWKLRALQEAGHKAVILLGDVTTAIGDPTGKSKARPWLSDAEIKKNIVSLKREVQKILLNDPAVLELRQSSEWYSKMKMREFLTLLSYCTQARLIERDMFQKRIEQKSEIFMHEMVYPILQGYDSVMLKSDLTIIGSDQLFNEHMGRFLQEKLGQRPQVIAALKILPGIEGREKMSKSLGNYIGISDPPVEKFGKIMRIPDSLILPYLEAYTDVSTAEIKKIGESVAAGSNPRDAKAFLAEAVVRRYHGNDTAIRERERFQKTFSERVLPQNAAVILLDIHRTVMDAVMLSGGVSSKSEARRLFKSGAIEMDGRVIRDPHESLSPHNNATLRIGKKKFLKIKIAPH
ncbi:MAG: tyrosine--tRNA ligase [Candidatus Sungbacteria bacterium]|nr:tyrosine--tRNA ligase [Candidatus Sungbacteria bacterium]